MNFTSRPEQRDGFTQMGLDGEPEAEHQAEQVLAIVVFDINAFIIGNGSGRLAPTDFAAGAKGLNSAAAAAERIRPDSGVRKSALSWQ